MNGITGNAKAVMAAGTETVQEGNSVFTDLVMEGLDVQFSPSQHDQAEGTDNARLMKQYKSPSRAGETTRRM